MRRLGPILGRYTFEHMPFLLTNKINGENIYGALVVSLCAVAKCFQYPKKVWFLSKRIIICAPKWQLWSNICTTSPFGMTYVSILFEARRLPLLWAFSYFMIIEWKKMKLLFPTIMGAGISCMYLYFKITAQRCRMPCLAPPTTKSPQRTREAVSVHSLWRTERRWSMDLRSAWGQGRRWLLWVL